MKKLFPMFAVLVLTSCASKSGTPVLKLVDPKIYDDIQVQVSKADWEVKRSLLELKYVKEQFPLSRSVSTVKLQGADGQRFEVIVLGRPSMSFPGTNFILAYLKNPEGKIVHWKSRWLYNRLGSLTTRLLDVNDDGVKEFCFVASSLYERTEQVLAAYAVRSGRFEPVIPEQISHFTVEFEETVLPDGLVLQPKLKGKYGWETEKLYEIPLRVINRSSQARNLKGCYVLLAGDYSGGCSFPGFKTETLVPGDSVETTITVRISQGFLDRKFGFLFERPQD